MSVETSSPNIEPWLLPEMSSEHLVEAGSGAERAAGFTSERDKSATVQRPVTPMTAGRLAELERVVREEGYSSGRAEGYEKGYAEGEARARELGVKQTLQHQEQLSQLIDSITIDVSSQTQQLQAVLTDLVAQITRQLYYRELQLHSSIDQVVGAAIAALPLGEQHIKIFLHVEDIALLESLPGFCKPQWQLLADENVSRGGCRVESEYSNIDATFEQRLAEIITQTFDADSNSPV